MPRTAAFIASLLTVALFAAACGGGDDTAQEAEDARTNGVSEVTRDDGDQPDTVSDSAEQTEQPDTDAQPEPEPVAAPVRLGTRFEWCVDIQRGWDWLAEIQGQASVEEAALRDAQETLEAATDELDRVEAFQVFESAERRVGDLIPILVDAADEVVEPVQPGWSSREETEVIAVGRARDAFVATTDPALVELLAAAYSDASLNEEPTEPAEEPLEEPETAGEALSLEELLSELEQLRDDVDGLRQESAEPYSAVQVALSRIHAAQNPRDAMDAYERFLDAALALEEFVRAASTAHKTAGDAYWAYRWGVGGALNDGEISREEHDSRVAYAYETYETIEDTASRIGYIFIDTNEWMHVNRFKRLGRTALQEAANAFVLSDTAWAAFQMSLSESCQP